MNKELKEITMNLVSCPMRDFNQVNINVCSQCEYKVGSVEKDGVLSKLVCNYPMSRSVKEIVTYDSTI